ncbi:hypothetical protein MRX96_021901 [Rhipicephalus microplus]
MFGVSRCRYGCPVIRRYSSNTIVRIPESTIRHYNADSLSCCRSSRVVSQTRISPLYGRNVRAGAEALVVQDGEYFDIVNTSAPHVRVHVVLSERSRFVLNVILDDHELYGKFSFKYLEPIKGMRLTALTVDNGKNVQFASSRMDMGGRTAAATLSYVLPNGTLLVNATIVVTPFSYTGDTFCTNHWDCRRFRSNCTKGRCECGPGNAFQSRELFCTKICKADQECSALGSRNSHCSLGKCACCIDDSICTSGAICESTRCVCSSGSLRLGRKVGCERHSEDIDRFATLSSNIR